MAESNSRKWFALTGISLLSFVVFIDFTIVNTILPGIQRDLSMSLGDLQWVINGFVMMLTVTMVTLGRLGDIYGRRRVLYLGASAFAAVSVIAGMAQSAEVLIACRIAQGIAAASALTCGVALVNHHFPGKDQGLAVAVFMSICGFGMAAGPVLGGLFMSFASWRWAFYINVLVAAAGLLISWRTVDETPRQQDEKVDWLGLLLFTPGLGGVVVAVMQGNNWGWRSPATLAAAAVGVACLFAFVRVERRVASPMIDFRLFRNRLFLACMVMALGLGGFITVGSFLAPLYLQSIRNELPYVAGFMLLPISALVVIVPPLIGGWAGRVGELRFIVAGLALLTLSAVWQLFFAPASPVWFVLLGLGLFGLGWGLQQATSAVAATSALPPASAGLAIGVLYSVWNLGSCIGLAVAGLILEEIDRHRLTNSLALENITLSAADQHLVRSLLSDPSAAHDILAKLGPGLESRILPLFKDAFMAGYHGAMWYLVVTCALATVLVPLIAGRGGARAER